MIRRTVTGAVVVAACILATPGAALADAPGPSDYRSEIVSITPPAPVIDVTIEGGDSFVHITVDEGHEVIVLGYLPDQEPYLRISADGTVEHNVRSFATYYNEERYGGDDVPAIVDTTAPPAWERIGGGGSWAWHDHRAHWMGDQPPVGLEPGESLPSQVIPLVVDGEPVEIEVVTTLVGSPSVWPAVFGLLVGLQLVFVGRLLGPATTVLSTLLLSVGALLVGAVQFRSLPAETGPLVTWWLLPAIATGCAAAAIATYGRSTLLRAGLVAVAAVQLLVWALRRRAVLTRPVLPTDLPPWLDRAATAAILVGSIGLTLLALRDLFTEPAADRAAASTPSV
jgi:hypothetical protein